MSAEAEKESAAKTAESTEKQTNWLIQWYITIP
jgi:hypothetical protein